MKSKESGYHGICTHVYKAKCKCCHACETQSYVLCCDWTIQEDRKWSHYHSSLLSTKTKTDVYVRDRKKETWKQSNGNIGNVIWESVRLSHRNCDNYIRCKQYEKWTYSNTFVAKLSEYSHQSTLTFYVRQYVALAQQSAKASIPYKKRRFIQRVLVGHRPTITKWQCIICVN